MLYGFQDRLTSLNVLYSGNIMGLIESNRTIVEKQDIACLLEGFCSKSILVSYRYKAIEFHVFFNLMHSRTRKADRVER